VVSRTLSYCDFITSVFKPPAFSAWHQTMRQLLSSFGFRLKLRLYMLVTEPMELPAITYHARKPGDGPNEGKHITVG